MRQELDKFIDCAARRDRQALDRYAGAEVVHPVFGVGALIETEMREMAGGPLFRIRFGKSVREFNLESFRDGFFTRIVPAELEAAAQTGPGPTGNTSPDSDLAFATMRGYLFGRDTRARPLAD